MMTFISPMASTDFTEAEFDPDYYPDLTRFAKERSKRLASHEAAPAPLEEFQLKINHDISWDGASLDASSYTWDISHSEMSEINNSCDEFNNSGKNLYQIEKGSFHLPPALAKKFAVRRHDLHHGTGILLIRGLQLKDRSRRESFALFAGLASHLSEKRGRQPGNKYLTHITDLTAGDDPNKYAAPYCNHSLPFHTDAGDLVAMLVLKSAANGGDGIFAPVSTVYNKLAQSSPDLIPVLMRPDWPFDRPPDRSVGAKFYKRPVMFLNHDDQPEMIFSRGALIRSPRGQRPVGLPKLTRIQCEALDAVHFAAENSVHRIQYREGDLLFFNNRRILHGRDSFLDTADIGQRHMLRLWLKDEEMAGTPSDPNLQKLWGNIFAVKEDGEYGRREDLDWPIMPDPF